MATTDTIIIKAESLVSNSVGQRPTYETASSSLRPEGAIARWRNTAHALSGLWLLRVTSFRRALPYANAERALPLAGFNSLEFGGIENANYGEFTTIKLQK